MWPWPSSAAMAVVAPRPASTHPSSETTRTGSCRSGSRWTSKISVRPPPSGLTASDSSDVRRHLEEAADLGREAVDAALVARPRPGHVAGVDPLEDAGQLPVPERHVVADPRDVEVRDRAVALQDLGPGGESRRRGGREAEHGHGVGGVGPVDHQQPRGRPGDRRACRSPSRGWPAPSRRRRAPRCPCGSPRAPPRCVAAWGCAGPARRSHARRDRRGRLPRPASARTARASA